MTESSERTDLSAFLFAGGSVSTQISDTRSDSVAARFRCMLRGEKERDRVRKCHCW